MQVVRKTGSWLLRAWAWPPTPRVVAGAPASTIHTGAQQLQDAAAKQEVEEKVAAPAPSRSSFSIYPPVPGQESPLRWAGKKFEEIPIAHIKASYNNTQIQVVSAAYQPLVRTSCGTEGFRNAKKGTGIAAQTAGIAAAVVSMCSFWLLLWCVPFSPWLITVRKILLKVIQEQWCPTTLVRYPNLGSSLKRSVSLSLSCNTNFIVSCCGPF
ncbi:28S ribosomal protein S11, mitochondrial isoform X1 [Ursus arctos]|uniref:28S ribosomal protein S11, mitochondrial isoform X1 n=1 Tax=Ursus arctos TaxID=9644 RepID=UPI002547A795|nr:28S ribosomal protein S11, mitochondrial isoform X1 [Ursus arctos]